MKDVEAGSPGEITADAVYALDELQQRLQLGRQAWRTARDEGLPVRPVGRRKYVLGRDVVEWIASKPIETNSRIKNEQN